MEPSHAWTYLMEDQYDHPDQEWEGDLAGSPGDPFNNQTVDHDGLEPVPSSGTLPYLDPETGEESNPKAVIDNLNRLKRWEQNRKSHIIQNTDIAWQLYNCDYDFSDKKDWQAKIATPKFNIAVERVVATLLRMLEDSDNWFDIRATSEDSELYFNLVEKLIQSFLDTEDVRFRKFFKDAVKVLALNQHVFVSVLPENEGFPTVKQPIKKENSYDVFSTGADPVDLKGLDALIGRPVVPKNPKKTVDTATLPGKNSFRINLSVLNTDYCYKDSRNRDLYKITESYYTVGELKLEAKARGWDMEQVNSAIHRGDPGNSRTGRDGISHASKDEEKAGLNPDLSFGKEAKVTYFYGTLIDETDGDVVLEDSFLIMVNDCEIVYGPEPLSSVFWGGVTPVVDAPFIDVPHAAYGKSPLVSAVPQFIAWNEFYNLMYDYYKGVILGVKEVDTSLIEDWEYDFRDGIWPGQTIMTDKSQAQGRQAVTNVAFTDPPAQFHNFVQMFQQELQDNVLLSDTISGGSRSRGRVTAMEFQRRAADAGSMLESLFESLEEHLLVKVIYQIFYRILQFMPQEDWSDFVSTHARSIAPRDPQRQAAWDAIYEDLKTWDAEKRWGELAGRFKFKVRVFSALADRQMEIEKATFMMQTVAQNPAASQHLIYPRILRYIIRSFGWNPEEIISAEALPLPTGGQFGEQKDEGPEGQGQGPGPSLGAPTSLSTGTPQSNGIAGSGVPGVRTP